MKIFKKCDTRKKQFVKKTQIFENLFVFLFHYLIKTDEMKRCFLTITLLIATFSVSNVKRQGMTEFIANASTNITPKIELLYDNIWGSIYHAEIRQCDSTPTVTGDGSKINPYKASDHRWIAISQEMINDMYRAQMIKRHNDKRFQGKIQYGDTIWIESSYSEINGWWVVRDAKNKCYTKSIDFLQTKGDKSLISNYPRWSGKFQDLKIYRIENYQYRNVQKLAELYN
jgi:hypothetical protein